jgi:hypothetical protein
MTDRTLKQVPESVEVLQGSPNALIKELRTSKVKTGDVVLIRIPGTEAHRRKIADALKVTMYLVENAMRAADERLQKLLVEMITPAPPLPPINELRKLRMMREARQMVIESSEWLKATDLASRSGKSSKNPSTIPNRWKSDGRIFAINIDGVDYFPAYGLHEATKKNVRSYEPKPILKALIAALGETFTGWQIAEWFASPNGYLHGARPLDLLDKDPNGVEKAAEFEAKGVQHG